MSPWISVKDRLPPCKRSALAPGIPVLIWPQQPDKNDGFCYYGRRATVKPAFYIYGAEIHGVTHWQPMPIGPTS